MTFTIAACPGKNVEWTKMAQFSGYFSNDTHLKMEENVWTLSRCKQLCEPIPGCKAVKFDSKSGICILADGNLKKVDQSSGSFGYYRDWEYHYYTCVEGMCFYR